MIPRRFMERFWFDDFLVCVKRVIESKHFTLNVVKM